LPDDEEMIRRISKVSVKQWKRTAAVLKSFFSPTWKHARIDEDLAQAVEKSQTNSTNALKRYRGRSKVVDEKAADAVPSHNVRTPVAPSIAAQTPDSRLQMEEEGSPYGLPSAREGFIGSLISEDF
jgi:uncharacterized protein YdaU (DUF1376 family)